MSCTEAAAKNNKEKGDLLLPSVWNEWMCFLLSKMANPLPMFCFWNSITTLRVVKDIIIWKDCVSLYVTSIRCVLIQTYIRHQGTKQDLNRSKLLPSSTVQAKELLARDSNVAIRDAFGSRSRVRYSNFKTYLFLINPGFLVWFLGLKNSTTLSISRYMKGMVLSSQNGNLNNPWVMMHLTSIDSSKSDRPETNEKSLGVTMLKYGRLIYCRCW